MDAKPFKPAPLADVLKDMQDEAARAHDRLPKWAQYGPQGQKPRAHQGWVNSRLHSFDSAVHLLQKLRRMEVAGTLPPELLE